MKIYTYYDDINFDHQNELIHLWKWSWLKYNFTPIVLSHQDAHNHEFYNEFKINVTLLHKIITGNNLSDYGLTCYLRWLAYANQSEKYFYFSDYDIINNGFDPEKPIDKLHMMDDCCPCFGSGCSESINQFCKLIIDLSTSHLERLSSLKLYCYHDQDFMINNRQDILNIDWIQLSRNRQRFCSFYEYEKDNKCSVIHFAHNNMSEIKKQYFDVFGDMNEDILRIMLIKKLLRV